ncbi:MAG TPA: hypothetical protein VHX15_01630 [Frankiaceae bacterium]|nr:hypothetical protein [Frankiaceae bacterium]
MPLALTGLLLIRYHPQVTDALSPALDRPRPGSADFMVVHTHWSAAAPDAEPIAG